MAMGFSLEITPCESVGEARLDSKRATVRKAFRAPDEAVRKPDWNSQLTDFYTALGRPFAYDPDGLLAEVELTPLATAVGGRVLAEQAARLALPECRRWRQLLSAVSAD
jgi:hypothetical protein